MEHSYSDTVVLQTFHSLPKTLQEEALHFMQYLQFKRRFSKEKKTKNNTGEKTLEKRQLGVFPKGTFELADDFDAPLEDFKEYM